MTDPVTRARAAMMRVWEREKNNPLMRFMETYIQEVSREIEQAVLVERQRCLRLIASYKEITALAVGTQEIRKYVDKIAADIEQGIEPDD